MEKTSSIESQNEKNIFRCIPQWGKTSSVVSHNEKKTLPLYPTTEENIFHCGILFWTCKQYCDVVLVRMHLAQENPRGSGFWNGEGMGRGWKWGDQFMRNLGPRWTGSYHNKEGSK
jgi:hypothetical protein